MKVFFSLSRVHSRETVLHRYLTTNIGGGRKKIDEKKEEKRIYILLAMIRCMF
jgi:hypothetical protein